MFLTWCLFKETRTKHERNTNETLTFSIVTFQHPMLVDKFLEMLERRWGCLGKTVEDEGMLKHVLHPFD